MVQSQRTRYHHSLISYELYGRLYKFLTPALPWDHTTAFGFTVRAVTARLLGLNAEKIAHAIAMSAAQSATLGVVGEDSCPTASSWRARSWLKGACKPRNLPRPASVAR
jgi:2-methylcitrate dehydratase PrpD